MVQRKHEHFTNNVLGLMGSIASLFFYVFAIGVAGAAPRSGVALTLLLTAVAFKLAAADSLPQDP